MEDIEVIGSQEALQSTSTPTRPSQSTSTLTQPSQNTTNTTNSQLQPVKTPVQNSWVWAHFILLDDRHKVQCRFPKKENNGSPCNQILVRGDRSSTKSMGDHLKAIHNMYPPPKENMNENHLSKVVKRQRMDQRVSGFFFLHSFAFQQSRR
ncbi:hypothetical protein PSHT_05706 [Puccinia striiformis]|uniref:BED-type domain-containing protein n=1 Tax=Puccinia striiformis TaxID=27350 RepID=A0A2S4W9X1_9BASI|nr:hypothetical protein PSHT_05706 [Puccinia striiformis]